MNTIQMQTDGAKKALITLIVLMLWMDIVLFYLKQLAQINYELAQMVVSADEGKTLPEWFMIEIVRDMPRLVTD